MFSKANLTSTIVTALWGYFGGWLLWGYLSVDFFNDHLGSATGVMKEVPDPMMYLVAGCLIFAFAFSTLYGKWSSGNYNASSGVTFGVWLAVLLGLGDGLINFSTSNVLDLTGTFGAVGILLVFLVVQGLLAGVVYKKMS